MNVPERETAHSEKARDGFPLDQLAAHVQRLLYEGGVLSVQCEICRQIAAELGVSLPRDSWSLFLSREPTSPGGVQSLNT